MTDAPERIWACLSKNSRSGVVTLLGNATFPVGGWKEYIRADLIHAMLADARRQALEEAMRACLEERGDLPAKFYADPHGYGWFDGAQACADAIGVMLAEDAK